MHLGGMKTNEVYLIMKMKTIYILQYYDYQHQVLSQENKT